MAAIYVLAIEATRSARRSKAPDAGRRGRRSWELACKPLTPLCANKTQLEKIPSVISVGLVPLNQRVQGSSPCAPTIDLTAVSSFSSLEHPDHLDGHLDGSVPDLFAYATSSLVIASRAKAGSRCR